MNVKRMMEPTGVTTQPMSRSVWFALLAAPAVWAAQGLVGWFIETRACLTNGMTHVRVMELIVDIVALAIACSAMVVGWRAWSRSRDESLTAVHGRSRPDFLAATALLVAISFTLAVIAATYSSLFLPICESTR